MSEPRRDEAETGGGEKTGFCDYYGAYVNRIKKPCGKDANCLVCCAYQTLGEKRFLDAEAVQ